MAKGSLGVKVLIFTHPLSPSLRVGEGERFMISFNRKFSPPCQQGGAGGG